MNQNKVKVTAVSYLNTKPLLYGIFKSKLASQIELQLDTPAECAQKLKRGTVDLGLVPVAIIPELATPHVVSDYCIGTIGAVKTVAIYSDRPIAELDRIFLDHHSRTSVALTKLLLREYWQLSPELVPASTGYIDRIGARTGGLVIGDRAIGLEQRFAYVYDLGEIWQQHTGLPFVFAAWVSNRPLDPQFIEDLNDALRQGVAEIPQLMYLLPSPTADFDLQTYFTQYISYEFDAAKRQALRRFLTAIAPNRQPTLEAALSF